MTKSKGNGNQSNNGKSWGVYGRSLYKHWVERHGDKHVQRWLKKHKYDTKSCETQEFIKYMTDKFIDWVNRDN